MLMFNLFHSIIVYGKDDSERILLGRKLWNDIILI